ncbi:hypothetical protein [Streptomyces sp. 6N223]|uniref:hypothetical protein n=1 Tax=Streptomyces sp. 6N223 TaxID=3457412 RepID=UPI003FD56EBB
MAPRSRVVARGFPSAQARNPEGGRTNDRAPGTSPDDETPDTGYSPPDRPRAADAHGTTAREQREGETLDERLAEDTPDVQPPTGGDSASVGAEEAAMHTREPGEETDADTDAGEETP